MYLGLGESGKRRSGGEPARREIGILWVGPDLLLHPGEVVGRHAAHLLLRQAHHLRIHHRGGGRGSRSGGGGGGGRELADSGWDLVGELAPPSLAGWFLVPSLPAPLFFILLLFSSSSPSLRGGGLVGWCSIKICIYLWGGEHNIAMGVRKRLNPPSRVGSPPRSRKRLGRPGWARVGLGRRNRRQWAMLSWTDLCHHRSVSLVG